MTAVLERILAHKREEVRLAQRLAGDDLAARARSQPPVRSLLDALTAGEGGRVIAECKRASPSRGVLGAGEWDPAALAVRYADAGAAAVSVLTDTRFFWGQLTDLAEVKGAVEVPVLRKDFLLAPVQVWEARLAGADAVLLIAAALPGEELERMLSAARECGLEALVEVHDEEEADRAIAASARLVGVNNRNLHTFAVDLSVSERIAPRLVEAGCTVVSESGIFGGTDTARLARVGVRAFLVGEALVRAEQPAVVLAALVEGAR